MNDPYFYDDCPVLKNKLGIKDNSLLEKAEVDISCNAIHDLLMSPIHGDYDFAHFCSFHAYIFGEIYDWAGKPRIVPIEKEEAILGYMSIDYAKPQRIEFETVNALVAATAIFTDGDFRKPEYLFNIVKESLERGRMYAGK